MNEVLQLLRDARDAIDGEMDCHTAEYRAIDALHRAVERLAESVHEQLGQI